MRHLVALCALSLASCRGDDRPAPSGDTTGSGAPEAPAAPAAANARAALAAGQPGTWSVGGQSVSLWRDDWQTGKGFSLWFTLR